MTQLSLLNLTAPPAKRRRGTDLPEPWTRTTPVEWGKTSARFAHPNGWRIEHCGHPTANWPWALYDNKDNGPFTAPNGKAFRSVFQAALYVELHAGLAPWVHPGNYRALLVHAGDPKVARELLRSVQDDTAYWSSSIGHYARVATRKGGR